jgi:hypothetical protein
MSTLAEYYQHTFELEYFATRSSCFCAAPLFRKLFAGHWSPVAAYLPDKDLVLVLGKRNNRISVVSLSNLLPRFIVGLYLKRYYCENA